MLPHTYFRAWSALRTTAQEMTWSSVRPQIERDLPKLLTAAAGIAKRSARRTARRKGSLRLDPTLAIPKDMQQLDIHLMPGGFHSEFLPDDVAAGALYHHGTAVFAGGFTLRARGGGVAKSIAEFLKARNPGFNRAELLDLGCTVGATCCHYLEVFPACEAYGIDVCAPLLRYAHARAESLGAAVHYSQQNAEHTRFSRRYLRHRLLEFLSARAFDGRHAARVQGGAPDLEARRHHGPYGTAARFADDALLLVLL